MAITLTSEAGYGYEKKHFVARITGRDPKWTFARTFLGRKEGKRGDYTTVLIDEPGLYQTRDCDRKGRVDDNFCIVWADDGALRAIWISEVLAMDLARRLGPSAIAEQGRKSTIAYHEERIATNDAKPDQDEMVTLRETVGALKSGSETRLAEVTAARRAEVARLSGAMPIDRAALQEEAEKLRLRLAEIQALLEKGPTKAKRKKGVNGSTRRSAAATTAAPTKRATKGGKKAGVPRPR